MTAIMVRVSLIASARRACGPARACRETPDFPPMILPINRSLIGARVERISSARVPEMCPFSKTIRENQTVRETFQGFASPTGQGRGSTAGSGASALRPFAGGLSTSSATGDETHFCPVPLPRKTPSGVMVTDPPSWRSWSPRAGARRRSGPTFWPTIS